MKTHSQQRGIIILTFTVSLAFIILILGLAIDASLCYLIKGRLQSAADAAALAAARSLNLNQTQQQTADAQTASGNFFNADFPSGFLGTTTSTVTTTLVYGGGNAQNTVSITAAAHVNAPAYFMRWLGYANVPVAANGTATRRDINLIMILDQSGSMTTTQPGTSQTACAIMKTSAASFVDMFSNNRDTMGLVVFNGANATAFAPSSNFNSGMKSAINNINCNGNTGTAGGLNRAYNELRTLNNPTKLNVIMLFTDGLAQSVAASFPIKRAADSRYGDGASPYSNTATLYTMPASSCAVGLVTIAGGIEGGGSPTLTGASTGIFSNTNLSQPTVSGSGCSFAGSTSRMRRDIAYIPDTDLYGNSTRGYRTHYDFTTNSFPAGQDIFSGGAYANKLRPDMPQTIQNAAYNKAENQGITIRNDTTLNPMILTIGLGGNGAYPADSELLIRLANVPSGASPSGATIANTIYDYTRPQGYYVYSPDSVQLSAAFAKVASFLVQLSQ